MSDTHASSDMAGQDDTQEPSRRKLLIGLSLGSGALAAAAAGYPIAKAVLDPAFQKGGRGDWQTVGQLTDFPLWKTVLVTFIRPGARSFGGDIKKDTAYLTRRPGDWLALHNVCMHLGCPVRHQEGSGLYFCPCHGGVYNAEGINVAGPPRIPLQRLGVRVEGQDVQLQSAAMPLPTLTWPGGDS
ncbi:ubiquinol-cytochrome c reductase iron-sulfur subunit [Deinococcus marmoris]|uniref:Phytoene desaturase n=1 Tax=Deinococcus marmoris TaxID=249408 RepID=A0A1U7NTD8_9DEIO|nr:Rieske (2Fe-2S) protein [Deinococcus marmoris]OLV16189.1 Phytoene desaturase [Deinococcus marmoris]